ncbi:platelet endothelial cell adhesion molecule [Aplochiton taeniatus]
MAVYVKSRLEPIARRTCKTRLYAYTLRQCAAVRRSLRMDPSRAPHLPLFFTCYLAFWQGAGAQTLYTIDSVELSLLPSGAVASGTAVTLRCEVSVSSDTSLLLTHSFSFLRDEVPVFSRNTTETAVLLHLAPARAAHSGAYVCLVTVQDKAKRSLSRKLKVTGLQTPGLSLSERSLFEGEELLATCSAPEETGPLRFRFYQDEEEVKQVQASENTMEARLVLMYAGESSLHCDYVLTMLGDAGRSNRSNAVRVLVKNLHIAPVMNVLPSTSVFEGDIIEVVCKVVQPPSGVDVFLIKSRKVLKTAPFSLNHQMTVQEGDTGEYVCRAEKGHTQRETYKSVQVQELFSKPDLRLEPQEVFEGENVTLTCLIFSYSSLRVNPENIRYSIYKGHVQLSKTEQYTAVARSSLNGNYTCQANTQGQNKLIVKESRTVAVQAKVPVSTPFLTVVGNQLVVGKPFQLRCHSERGSLPIEYTLRSPGTQAAMVVSRPWEQAVFNITSIQRSSDLRSFVCRAKNNDIHPVMESSADRLAHATNVIEPVSRPVLTLMPSTADVVEGHNLTLVCTVQRGTPPVTFAWYHTVKEAPIKLQTVREMKGAHTITGLSAEQGGGYYCVASNPSDDVRRSQTVEVGVKMAGWKKGLIASFCIVLAVALILAVIVKKGILPRRRKGIAELSVKPAGTKTERLSLTLADANEAANVTPGVMGRSVWSEHVSGSESEDQNSVGLPDVPETQYTEVQIRQVDPARSSVHKGADTVYSEVRNSKQGSSEQADGGSVEYAQLNHDDSHQGELSSNHENGNGPCNEGEHADHNGYAERDDYLDEIDDLATQAESHRDLYGVTFICLRAHEPPA